MSSNPKFRWPTNYVGVTQPFKNTGSDKHYGDDLGWSLLHGGKRVPIMSPYDGTIYLIDHQQTGGNVVIINHHNGFFSEHGHLSKIIVKVGEKVKMGQQIGNMGNSGYYKKKGKWIQVPFHEHYGLFKGDTFSYKKSNWADPMQYTYLYPDQQYADKTLKTYGNKLKYYKNELDVGVYKTNYNMNIRKTPGGAIVKVKDCTNAMQKALTSKKPNDNAVIKKGTKFTVLEVIEKNGAYWGKNYSGYVCLQDNKNVYCKKA